jgi:hypothetical protein
MTPNYSLEAEPGRYEIRGTPAKGYLGAPTPVAVSTSKVRIRALKSGSANTRRINDFAHLRSSVDSSKNFLYWIQLPWGLFYFEGAT